MRKTYTIENATMIELEAIRKAAKHNFIGYEYNARTGYLVVEIWKDEKEEEKKNEKTRGRTD